MAGPCRRDSSRRRGAPALILLLSALGAWGAQLPTQPVLLCSGTDFCPPAIAALPSGKLALGWLQDRPASTGSSPRLRVAIQHGRELTELPSPVPGRGHPVLSVPPALATARDGTVYVAWLHSVASDEVRLNDVLLAAWNGERWTGLGGSAVLGGISRSGTARGMRVALALDEHDRPVCAWLDQSDRGNDIFLRRWIGANWQPMAASGNRDARISDSGSVGIDGLHLIRHSDDSLIAAWSSGDKNAVRGRFLHVRRWDGLGWHPVPLEQTTQLPPIGGDAHRPVLASASGAPLLLGWDVLPESGGVDEIYLRRWNGFRWAEASAGSASGTGASDSGNQNLLPAVVATRQGAFIAWEHRSFTSPDSDRTVSRVYARVWDGFVWRPAFAGSDTAWGVGRPGRRSCAPAALLSEDNGIAIVWTDPEGLWLRKLNLTEDEQHNDPMQDPPLAVSPAGYLPGSTGGQPTFRWHSGIPDAWHELDLSRDDGWQWSGIWIHRKGRWHPPASLARGAYTWRVRTWDSKRGFGVWSLPRRFHVPGFASPLALQPAGTVLKGKPLFRWTPIEGAEKYQVAIRRADGGEWQAFWCEDGHEWNPEQVDLPTGSYMWWVRAWDDESGAGSWSRGLAFRVQRMDRPLALLPEGTLSDDKRPRFSWSPVESAEWYQLSIQRSDGWQWPGIWVKSLTEWRPPVWDLAPGTYTWWVQSWSTANGTGEWSPSQTFTVPGENSSVNVDPVPRLPPPPPPPPRATKP